MSVRAGRADDVAAVHGLVVELAVFEQAPDAVVLSPEQMRRDFEAGAFGLFVAEAEEAVVGFALYYGRYSTWTGRCLYLEDLFVREAHRGRGVGTALFRAVIGEAAQRDCARMEWVCLNWNTTAVDFYRQKFDAHIDDTWLQCKLVREQLQRF